MGVADESYPGWREYNEADDMDAVLESGRTMDCAY
jgi:hypothetical protein